MKAHKNNTLNFKELSNSDKARSISAMTNNLYNAIKHIITHSDDPKIKKIQYEEKIYKLLV
jgi:hypothetical protein